MKDIHVLLIDGEEKYLERAAGVVNEIAPNSVHIHKTGSLKYAQDLIDKKVKIAAIVIDMNLKNMQDVPIFISALSGIKKSKLIAYSKNDEFRRKCRLHLHMATVKKERSTEALRSALTLLLERLLK